METAAERLNEVHDRIAKAAKVAGRKAEDVTLIAVSKVHVAKTIRPVLEAGQVDFGENRVQEAAGKWPDLRADFSDVRLHMIGQLQSNKAEDAAALFDAIHSIDRPSLVKALGKAYEKTGRTAQGFVQVDIGDEPQKGGCPIAKLPDLLAMCADHGVPVSGLMCIPPGGIEAAPYFALLRKFADRHGLAGLSMGMSGDFETAVMLGATHVRVGTSVFGERPE